MSATELQKPLLDAIKLLSENVADNTVSVKSAKATILNIIDGGLGTYMISYGGNQFEATASNPNIAYNKGDIVYVLIPNGDFSQQKIIIGAVSAHATMYSPNTEQSEKYIDVSEDLLNERTEDDNIIKLASWTNIIPQSDEGKITIDDFGRVFADYLNTYRHFLFSAKIKTNIDKDHQVKGNYGLILKLPFLAAAGEGSLTQTERLYVMDVNSMQGNPYAYSSEQLINLYFDIDEGLIYDTDREPQLWKFVEGFGYTAPRTDINFDIAIRDVQLKVEDALPASEQSGYHLSLVASKGNYFLTNEYDTVKTLTPILKLDGKDTSITSWECYWFVEDPSIDITSDRYSTIGGLGWKCLNDKTNISYDGTGKQSFQYVVNKYNYKVKQEDVVVTLKYKCILVQDDVVLSAILQLKNLDSTIENSLFTTTGTNVYIDNTGYANIIARLYYPNQQSSESIDMIWQRFDKNNNYLDNDFYERVRVNSKVDVVIGDEIHKCYETEIKIPCSSIDELNTIKCTFYKLAVKGTDVIQTNLGSKEIVITTTQSLGARVLMSNADVVYKYDADGDSPLVANYDGPASSRLKTIQPISFRIFKDNGEELNESEYAYCQYTWSFPKNSMLKPVGYSLDNYDDNYYYISGYAANYNSETRSYIMNNNLNYNIDNTYSKSKSDNTILFKATFAGTQVQDSVSIKFLKDGESGTNGTRYSAIIKYEDYAYGEKDEEGRIRKLQMVYIGGDAWHRYDIEAGQLSSIGSPQLSVEVFKDGNIITDPTAYSVSWEMFDAATETSRTNKVNFNINRTTGVISLKSGGDWSSADEIYTNVARAVVSIKDDATNTTQVLYVYYPIEITRLANSTFANSLIPTLDGGFSEVLYSSSGLNPSWDNSKDFICTNNISDNASNYYTYEWDSSSNINVDTSIKKRVQKITPVNKFEDGNSKNYVKVDIRMSVDQETELNNLINTTDAEINEAEDYKNYYNGIKTHLLAFVQNFSYNNYIENYLSKSKLLLSYVGSAFDILNNLESAASDIINYCDGQINPTDFDYETLLNQYNIDIDNASSALHGLFSNGGISALVSLSEDKIILNETTLKEKYGVSIYYQLIALTERWNLLIDKYVNYYNILRQESSGGYTFQSQVNYLHDLYSNLLAFVNNSNLTYLTSVQYGLNPQEEFVNLKSYLSTFVSKLANDSQNYTDVDNILKNINNLLLTYQDTDYQNYQYDNIIKSFQDTIKEKEKELEGYEAAKLPSTVSAIIHIRPVIMMFNRYEFSQLNAWDGNKLYIDENNDQYLLAPQVGAGKKENNRFTGLLMGIKKLNSSTNQEIGLFGYHNGVQSFLLNAETGAMELGKVEDGQIKITPGYSPEIYFTRSSGRIYSGSHSSLNSTQDGFYLASDGLSIGYGFKVDEKGILSLGEGNGRIVIDPGNQTRETKFYSDGHDDYIDTTDGFYLAPNGLSIGQYFRVDEHGNLTATSGTFSGSLNGATGTFSGDLSAAGGTFTGTLSADCLNGGTINGNYISVINLDASNITSGTIDSARIDTNTLTIYTESGAYKTILEDGDIKFYYNNSWSGYIRSIAGGGLEIVPNGNIQLGQGYGHYVVIYGTLVNTAGQYYAYTTESTGIPRTGEITANYYSGTGNAIDFYNAHSTTPSGDPAENSNQRAATIKYVDQEVSDRRLKQNIISLQDISDIYMKLKPVQFEYLDGIKETKFGIQYGLIAQDVETIDSNLIYTMDSCGKTIKDRCGDKFLNLKYESLHAWHIQMIQKQQHKIKELTNELICLKGELDIIKQKIGG